MQYPFKYPEVYAELARQGKPKKALADHLNITAEGLRWKQTHSDFGCEEMIKTAKFLGKSVDYLFGTDFS